MPRVGLEYKFANEIVKQALWNADKFNDFAKGLIRENKRLVASDLHLLPCNFTEYIDLDIQNYSEFDDEKDVFLWYFFNNLNEGFAIFVYYINKYYIGCMIKDKNRGGTLLSIINNIMLNGHQCTVEYFYDDIQKLKTPEGITSLFEALENLEDSCFNAMFFEGREIKMCVDNNASISKLAPHDELLDPDWM